MKKNQLFLYAMIFVSFVGLNTDVQCDDENYVGEIAIVNDTSKDLHIAIPVIGSKEVDSDVLTARTIGNFERCRNVSFAQGCD